MDTAGPPHPKRPHAQQERAVRTRALVLATAAEMFAETGFQRTCLTDVAERAGITKGAVYFHFHSKEALAVAVVEAHYSHWPTLEAEVRALRLGPLATLLELIDRAAVAFRDDTVVRAGARLQSERSGINTPLPIPYVGWVDRLTVLLKEAEDAGELRPGVEPAATARVIVSAFFGLQHVSDVLHGRTDLVERWYELRDLVLAAIKREGEPARGRKR